MQSFKGPSGTEFTVRGDGSVHAHFSWRSDWHCIGTVTDLLAFADHVRRERTPQVGGDAGFLRDVNQNGGLMPTGIEWGPYQSASSASPQERPWTGIEITPTRPDTERRAFIRRAAIAYVGRGEEESKAIHLAQRLWDILRTEDC